MKAKKTHLILATILFITIFFSLSFIVKNKIEKQIFYGQTITTESLHNAEKGLYDPNVYGVFANAWFRKYTLSISLTPGWHFTGTPFVHCVRNNQGAFEWNRFDVAHDRFYQIERGPRLIKCICWAGSRSIDINLGCEAEKDGNSKIDDKIQTWSEQAAPPSPQKEHYHEGGRN